MGDFRQIVVWNKAIKLSVAIYHLTSKPDFRKDFGLRDQIRRAGVSIPSNIAEGDESGSNKVAVRFFNIAKGSVAEVRTQLVIAKEIGYIESEEYSALEAECYAIAAMLAQLIKARSKD